uniref:RING-type domain-containing protein n=1 Tax=Anas platyrhynchos platyrhynchos TaxID=8840 RepID=A0A493TZV7_ANAPP
MPIRAHCSICSDFFDNERDVAALLCGHTFHSACLSRWFEAAPSRTCPQCRTQVSKRHIITKLFFNVTLEEQAAPDAETLQVFGVGPPRGAGAVPVPKLLPAVLIFGTQNTSVPPPASHCPPPVPALSQHSLPVVLYLPLPKPQPAAQGRAGQSRLTTKQGRVPRLAWFPERN